MWTLVGRFSPGILLEDSSLDGTPYISYPRAVWDCSCYFLSWVPSRNGDPSKSVHKPENAECHEETETNEEGEDWGGHLGWRRWSCLWSVHRSGWSLLFLVSSLRDTLYLPLKGSVTIYLLPFSSCTHPASFDLASPRYHQYPSLLVSSSPYHLVTSPPHHLITLSPCHITTLPSHHLISSPPHCLTTPLSHHLATSSPCRLVTLSLCHPTT